MGAGVGDGLGIIGSTVARIHTVCISGTYKSEVAMGPATLSDCITASKPVM